VGSTIVLIANTGMSNWSVQRPVRSSGSAAVSRALRRAAALARRAARRSSARPVRAALVAAQAGVLGGVVGAEDRGLDRAQPALVGERRALERRHLDRLRGVGHVVGGCGDRKAGRDGRECAQHQHPAT
jgi:hypothetical protein